MRICSMLFILVGCCLLSVNVSAQKQAKPSSLQSLPIGTSSATSDSLLKADATAWNQLVPKQVALNRTPPLYDTDEPVALDITSVSIRVVRTGGNLLVQLSWRDPTHDAVELSEVPNTRPETRFRKVQTEANDRFFDAAAIMCPAKPGSDAISPSLQMGDVDHPVNIYYWNATRGSTVMQAHGRGTTQRTGRTFPANSTYENGHWNVVFELPDLPAGTPVAFAIWDGSQKDRDGRKYFSVWQVLE